MTNSYIVGFFLEDGVKDVEVEAKNKDRAFLNAKKKLTKSQRSKIRDWVVDSVKNIATPRKHKS